MTDIVKVMRTGKGEGSMNVLRMCSALVLIAAASNANAAGNPAGPHIVLRTYLLSGSGGETLQQGNNLVSTVRVNCPRNEASCTLALSAMDEVCTSDNGFGIYVTVDDNAVDPGISLFLAGPGTPCSGGSWSDSYAVLPGNHSVKLYTVWGGTTGVNQGLWSVNYTVTIP
jgi:hypothetical protein